MTGEMPKIINVLGAGLAGCEAAWQAARLGVKVKLYEMKPKKFTPAHESENFGELVCSNSLKSNDFYANACGLLKEEMRLLGSMIIEAADATKVPAGAALGLVGAGRVAGGAGRGVSLRLAGAGLLSFLNKRLFGRLGVGGTLEHQHGERRHVRSRRG